MQRQYIDDKNNQVQVTLFESYFSLFILEHSEFYKDIYFKLLDAIEEFIKTNRKSRSASYCLDNIFFDLNKIYPGCNSFANLKKNFNINAADTCIKKCAEAFLKFSNVDKFTLQTKTNTLSGLAYQTLFANPADGMNSVHKHLRCNHLFSEKHRGVLSGTNKKIVSTKDLGIVSPEFVTEKLKNYFSTPIECARFMYSPNPDSYVAKWLSKRNLPVIAGTSGSTEIMLSRVLPLVTLTREEMRIILIAQTASMISMGHHSFFECMLVADQFGYKIKETDTMIDFYLQCVPDSIRFHTDFEKYILSSEGAILLSEIPHLQNDSDDSYSSSVSDGLPMGLSVSM